MPGLCTSAFWNELFDIMHYFGGDGVFATLMRKKAHREQAFIQEQDKKLDSSLGLVATETRRNPRDTRLLHR